MPAVSIARPATVLLCVALVVGPLPARAEQTIDCSSRGFGYRYCPVDTGNRVELVNQRSLIGCHQNRSWGYDRHGVWVDKGCSAEFKVGDSGHNNKAVAAGAAIAGIAIIAALAANKGQQHDDVASWAVGSFTGYDEFERSNVQLTILPGGSVSGSAGRTEFSGSFKDPVLEAGRHRFRVQRSGNGFIATDEANAGHRVVFQRSGGGYGGGGY